MLIAGLFPAVAAGQSATVRVAAENFRSEPSGSVLAEVVAGTPLALGEARGQWRRAVIEGWIWARSVAEQRQEGHDLVVSAEDGENLRSAPNGRLRARVRPGTRLDRMESLPGWVRVRREGWIWEPSLEVEAVEEAAGAEPGAGSGEPDAATTDTTTPADAAVAAAARTAPADPAPATPQSGEAARRAWTIAGPQGLVVLESPTGDTLARIHPGATAQVVAREGGWTRVRIEGWTSSGALATPDPADLRVLEDVDPAELELEPERFRGRILAWTVQFIALQHAERFRSDFIEGEPFLLTRGPGDASGFVYAAVPQALIEDARKLSALERVRLVGRVRTARSALTGAPVLELLELRPVNR